MLLYNWTCLNSLVFLVFKKKERFIIFKNIVKLYGLTTSIVFAKYSGEVENAQDVFARHVKELLLF